MTVYRKVKTTLATLEGILADFKVSSLETSDEQTKHMFQRLINQTEDVHDKFKRRVAEIEREEPQYREENK